MAATDRKAVMVAGRRITLSNLDKLLYPAAGMTKGDVIDFYEAVAPAMLPHIVDRPVTRKRWPNGVDEPPFFQKALGSGVPTWVCRRTVHHAERDIDYPIADSAATLVWFAQLAALELHVPQWFFGPRGGRRRPDRLVIDLDPGPGTGLVDCARVARAVRDALGRSGADLVPVTSGSKGLHLYLGINDSMTSRQATRWAAQLADAARDALPDLVTTTVAKVERVGRVFIDWSQNSAAKTTIAPYSLRGRTVATVAAPRTWDELDDPNLAQLDYREVLRRLDRVGDPMAALGRPIRMG